MAETCVAFSGSTCVASGPLAEVALEARLVLDTHPEACILILDAETSEPLEVDLRGTAEAVRSRLETAAARDSMDTPVGRDTGAGTSKPPGRPKLGVVAREVTLLPRHWEWLSEQPGGASAALRRLVEEARKSTAKEGRVRRAREACYRFMNTLAGNEPGFEEALRALYAGDNARFVALTEVWPADVRDHARRLAATSFDPPIS